MKREYRKIILQWRNGEALLKASKNRCSSSFTIAQLAFGENIRLLVVYHFFPFFFKVSFEINARPALVSNVPGLLITGEIE